MRGQSNFLLFFKIINNLRKWDLFSKMEKELKQFRANKDNYVYLDEEDQMEELRQDHKKMFARLRDENAKFKNQLIRKKINI